jgi:hypothetical protein
LKTMAKFLRISHPNPDFPATEKISAQRQRQEKRKTTVVDITVATWLNFVR